MLTSFEKMALVSALVSLGACSTQSAMEEYKSHPTPRFYATSDYFNFGWSYKSSLNEPIEVLKQEALDGCQKWSAFPCYIHLENDEVVQPEKEEIIIPPVTMAERASVLKSYAGNITVDYKDQTFGGKEYDSLRKVPIITTKELYDRMTSGEEVFLFLPRTFYEYGIVGSYAVMNLQEMAPTKYIKIDIEYILEITGGRTDVPIVFYNWDGVRDVSAYDATLMAMKYGPFTNVYWYRGGMRYWSAYRLPLQEMKQEEVN